MMSPRPKFNIHGTPQHRRTKYHPQHAPARQIKTPNRRSDPTSFPPVWRECERNSLADGDYSAAFAKRFAKERKNHKARRSAMSASFTILVEKGLENRRSPEQIVGRLKYEGHPQAPCVQTVYNHIHRERKKGGKIHRKLRHRGRKRKPHCQGIQRRAGIPGRRDMEERPSIVEKRTRFGDLECDLIIGANQSGAIVTVNDRATGLAWMAKIKDRQAGTVRAALVDLLSPLRGKIHSITSDNGKEFTMHQSVSEELGCEWYFTKPYHSWERGSNENFNGLVRDYFPKGTEFHNIQKRDIEQVKVALTYRTANEAVRCNRKSDHRQKEDDSGDGMNWSK
jgi:transposase, IS30 family